MKLEAEFFFHVGEFACMSVDYWSECPDRVQIVAAWVQKDFAGTRTFYHVRSHSGQNSAVVQVEEQELVPYPSDDVLTARARERDMRREMSREFIAQVRAEKVIEQKAAEVAAAGLAALTPPPAPKALQKGA